MEINSEKIKMHHAWLTCVITEFFHWKEIWDDKSNSEAVRNEASEQIIQINERFLEYLVENRELLPLLNKENLERIEQMLWFNRPK